jgi:hypothetical protein
VTKLEERRVGSNLRHMPNSVCRIILVDSHSPPSGRLIRYFNVRGSVGDWTVGSKSPEVINSVAPTMAMFYSCVRSSLVQSRTIDHVCLNFLSLRSNYVTNVLSFFNDKKYNKLSFIPTFGSFLFKSHI